MEVSGKEIWNAIRLMMPEDDIKRIEIMVGKLGATFTYKAFSFEATMNNEVCEMLKNGLNYLEIEMKRKAKSGKRFKSLRKKKK